MLMLYYKIPRDIDQTSHRDVLFIQPSKWSDHTTQLEFQCTCNYLPPTIPFYFIIMCNNNVKS